MQHFYGIVEDRQDPLKIGRVRVRIHGIHTADKSLIGTPDLPWAQVLLPTTSAGLSGLGFNSHGLVEGTTVFGFFRDGSKQDPIIIGVGTGITTDGFKQEVGGTILSRRVDRGFNDPRRLTPTDYKGTDDDVTPTADSKRSWGLNKALDTAPIIPESLSITYTGSGSTITNPTLTESDLPYYPLYFGKSDLSKFARGDGTYEHRSISGIVESKDITAVVDSIKNADPNLAVFPNSKANPVYPYNKVMASESGHMLEIDDTLDAERIAVEHRSGTFHEIHPDGSQVTRIVNDNYTVVCKDNEVFVGGKVNVVVMGNSNIKTYGDVKLKGYGKGEIDVTGTMDIKSGGDMTLQSAKTLKLKAQVIQEGS